MAQMSRNASDEMLRKHRTAGQRVWVTLFADGSTDWWLASHIAHLEPDTGFAQVRASRASEVRVGLCEVIPDLSTGIDALTVLGHSGATQSPAEWITVRADQVLAPVDDSDGEDADEEEGSFWAHRDATRVARRLPRPVVRSDRYGTRPLYHQRHPWPAGTFVQGGTLMERVPATAEQEADPDVYVRDGHALVERGVFIEAFPRNPSTMLRGEAGTFEEAEDIIWAKWSRAVGCPSPTGDHEWEPRQYRNGAGYCKHCGLWGSNVLDLASIGSVCAVCGVGAYYTLIPRRLPDGSLDPREFDITCADHSPGMDVHEVIDALDTHLATGGTGPDLSWFEAHLPEGTSARSLSWSELRQAVQQGRRDLLDRAVAEQ